MEIGDTVICVDAKPVPNGFGLHPKLIKGRKYIVYGERTFPCGCQLIDVGLIAPEYAPFGTCLRHGVSLLMGDNIHWCFSSRFRKIEPLYRTIEVSSEIKKQELQMN